VLHPLSLQFYKKLLFKSDAVICISKAIYSYFGQNGNKRASVIYNGLVNGQCNEEGREVPAAGKLKFLLVGLISQNKGQLEALKAFEGLLKLDKAIELVLVGDGEKKYVDSLKSYCQHHKDLKGRVIFTGYKNSTEEFYRSCHYFLMFSKAEGFGRVTVEAMQYGVPVIGYRGAGTEEIVEDGHSGYLFTDFRRSLVDIHPYLRNQAMYNRLSQNAMMRACTKFSESTYCSNVVSVYDSLSAGAGRE
jgi:glycosyltransferase involved in cell wall biosynthesis